MRRHSVWLFTGWFLLLALAGNVVAQETAPPQHQEVIYGHKDGLAMTFDVFQPDEKPNGAAVVFIVSGGWFSKWSPPQQTRMSMSPFLASGYTGFAVRHGSSPRYSIAEAVSDVRQAVRTIRRDAKQYGIDPDRIGVYGMSAGGHLTLMLATTGDDGNPNAGDPLERVSSRITAGVAFVPPSDITSYVWSTPGLAEQYRRFPALDISKGEAQAVSPLFFVTEDDAPCLVISGGKDTLVLPEQGKWIHDKLDEAGVENKFIVYENSGHGLEKNIPQAVNEAVMWFDKYLQ
ncbi:alpha/beta hydrolase [Bremerella cremea]|uniref:Alpha/beta hydrolase n=1 Tax=Bremerella cremea TaxID=1031537 RepID=A0A368KPU3_9BACT|nr:alpha/beta hydrolase [Bremerella cremea]RCS43904.1 alpha/beta hydrolase [Bremerella cremea]